MTLTRWQSCTLDDTGSQALQDFEEELHSLEDSFNSAAATLTSQIAANNATSKTAPTLIIPTFTGADGIKLTWNDADTALPYTDIILKGSKAEQFGIYVSAIDTTGVGALTYDWDTTTYTFSINPRVDLNQQIDTITDDLISVILTYWSTYFTIENLAPGVVIGAMARTAFSGAENAAVTSTMSALEKTFMGTGVTWQQALNQLSIPTAETTDTEEDVFQQISDYVILASGNTFEKSGENLIVLRSLWTLMGGTSAKATELATALGNAAAGTPLVQWTQTTSTTTTRSTCDGGGTVTTATTTALENLNTKPSSTTGATPTVWWIEKVASSNENVKRLLSYGLTIDQIRSALDESDSNTHIISEADFLNAYTLSTADFYELLGYSDIEGIATSSMEAALNNISNTPASLATGWLSPALNVPTDRLLETLSPTQSMAEDITSINDSACLNPINKAPLIAFVAAVDNMMKAVVRQVKQLLGIVRPVLLKASGVISTAQQFFDDLTATTCITGLNFSTNVQIDILLTEIELFSEDIKVTFRTVDTMLELILPPPCKIENAIKDILGPLYPDENCLVEGISDLAANAYGKLLGLLPCIENPLSVLEIFNKLSLKTGAISSLVNAMLADLRRIQTQLNMLADIKTQDNVETTVSDCQSESLSIMVGRIKAVF